MLNRNLFCTFLVFCMGTALVWGEPKTGENTNFQAWTLPAADFWIGVNDSDGRSIEFSNLQVKATRGPYTYARGGFSVPGSEDGEMSWVHRAGDSGPYQMLFLSFPETERESHWRVMIPLPRVLELYTYRFDFLKKDYACDMVLMDRRQVPQGERGKLDQVEKPVTNHIRLPLGHPLLRFRTFYDSEGNPQGDTRASLVRTADGPYLQISTVGKAARVGLIIHPYGYLEERLKTLISSNDKDVLEHHIADFVEKIRIGPDGVSLEVQHQTDLSVDSYAFDFASPATAENRGKRIAFYDFESMSDGRVLDTVNRIPATVEHARIIGAGSLGSRSLYCGERLVPSRSRIAIDAQLRDYIQNNQFTVAFWYKAPMGSDMVGNSYWHMTRGGNGLGEKGFMIRGNFFDLGVLKITSQPISPGEIWTRVSGFRNEFRPGFTPLRIDDSAWNHIAMTVQDDRLQLFLNGNRTGEYQLPRPFKAESIHGGTSPYLAPEAPWVFADKIWGTLDNLAVYDYALNARQLKEEINRQASLQVVFYPSDQLADGQTPSTPAGDHPWDYYNLKEQRFYPDGDFSAEAPDAKIVEGKRGEALELGEEGLTIPHKLMSELSGKTLSLSYWVKVQKNTRIELIRTEGHWKSGIQLSLDPANRLGGVICGHFFSRDLYPENLPVLSLPRDTWSHVYLSFEGKVLQIFIDGKRQFRQPLAVSDKFDIRRALHIGSKGSGMIVDELRFFRRPLTEEEVQKLFTY